MCVEFETYKKELEEIKLTDHDKKMLVKALAENEPEKKAKRPVRPLRVALIAACVCLALVGTAFAATVGFFGIFSTSNGDGTVTREYREKLHPYDSLTDEARQNMEESEKNIEEIEQNGEDGDSDPIIREVMGSWQEIQERTGVDLIDSALLDGAELANYWPLQCYQVTYLPEVININRSHIIDGVTVTLIANVRMEGYEGTDGDVFSYEHTFDEAANNKSYTLSDGTVVYYWTDEYMAGSMVTNFWASFIYNGVIYSMSTKDAQRDMLSAEASAKQTEMENAGIEIDYDELNASLNQHQADPNTDYEGVFFRVLDSFTFD